MIKVYLDWNVMVGMKANRFPELTRILSDKEKFFIPYSTAHISDLSVSNSPQYIAEDLKYISQLTNNNFFSYDSKGIVLKTCIPSEILATKINYSDLDFEKILKSIQTTIQDPQQLDQTIKFFKSFNIEGLISNGIIDPTSLEDFHKIFPDVKNNPTIYGLITSLTKLYKNLDDKEDYKSLRKIIQKIGINSGHFNANKNPLDLIDLTYKKNNIDFDSITNKNFDHLNTIPKWFNEIVNMYLKLDIHGYKSDTIKVTDKKKQTFINTRDDASHSAFASICNIYLTNDSTNYDKTRIVYDKLNIKTKVFKPNEFINFYKMNLKNSTVSDFFNEMIDLLHEPIFHDIDNEDGTYFGRVAFLDKYLFNLFNKIYVPKSDTEGIYVILSTDYPNNNFHLTGYKEIEYLIKSFYDLFGKDIYENELFSDKDIEEIKNNIWIGRKWDTNMGSISIIKCNSYIQLYYDYSKINQSI